MQKKEEKKSLTLDDYSKKLEENAKWHKKHKVLSFFIGIHDFFRYRLWVLCDEVDLAIKFGFQRMFRGYDDSYVWGHCSENARLTLLALKELKKTKVGYPIIVVDEKARWEMSKKEQLVYQKRWDSILGKIILGFDSFLKSDDVFLKTNGKYDHAKSEKKRQELLKRWEEGAALYIKYYGNLWD